VTPYIHPAMMTAPALRLATPDDVETLADAWYAMLEEDRLLAPEVDPRWRSYITADFRTGISVGSHVWVVAEEGGRIVATGAAFFRGGRSSLALTGLTATLAGVYTFPDYRRRGLARAVVGRLIELCRTRGCRIIRLRASDQGRPLYAQFGFVAGDEMVLRL
jgi:GNAT superfamily N-acetyltransferase